MSAAVDTNSLRKRAIRGGVWSVAGHIVSQGIRLGGNLITTRLLVPELFGLMAVANVILIGIEMLSDLGVRQNIVQSKRGDHPDFLNTAWTIQILRGLILSCIILVVSGLFYVASLYKLIPAGTVYADPRLPIIIAVLSITSLIAGLESTKLATANRHISVGRITLLEIISQALGPALIIAWCYYDRSFWALIAGWFAVSMSRMLLSHLILPGVNNRLCWDKECATEIYHFGKWVFVSSILGFLLNNGDRLLFGFFLSAREMGIYAIAFMMVSALESLLRKLLSNVSYPALSEVYRHHSDSFSAYYYKFRLPIDVISLFTVGFVFICGHWVIDLLYDERYKDAGWMLEIMVFTLFFIRYDIAGLCYLVVGKPKLLTLIILIRVIAVYVLVPTGFILNGMELALWIVAVNYALALPLMFYFNKEHGFFNFFSEIKVLPVFIIGLLFGLFFTWFLGEFKIAFPA